MTRRNEVPDFDIDPTSNLNERLSRFEQQTQLQQLSRAIAADEQRFAQENPDYYDALETIREKHRVMLEAQGVPPDQLDAAMGQQELQAAAQVMQNGASPAKYAYELARTQYGFAGGGGHGDTQYERAANAEEASLSRVLDEAMGEAYGGNNESGGLV